MPRIATLASSAVIASVVAALGCSVDAQQEAPFTADTKSYALIAIERTQALNAFDTDRARATVGFARLAPGQWPNSKSLRALGTRLPERTSCVRFPQPDDGVEALEFLDAGDVVIEATGSRTPLAPRALPTVDGFLSGVIYTTRDQDARWLPSDERYAIRAVGGDVSRFVAEASAPRQLSGINVNGLPLESLGSVSGSRPLDVSWEEGAASDTVFVEVLGADGRGIACAFKDDLGAGTVPAPTAAPGKGHVSFHRIRTQLLDGQSGEFSFDFEVTLPIELQR